MNEAVLFAPIYVWPMYIEPNPWTNEKPGGYLLNELHRMNDLFVVEIPQLYSRNNQSNFLTSFREYHT